ncbi:MAG: hypothetical protein KDK36_09065, partial [Leptospiraceae bacterium]|nr:hypothetical protein [Leptospiraceae bacterium]
MGQYFQKNGAILLKGESEFYWNKLLSSEEDFLTNLNHKRIIEIPGKWNNQFIDGKYLPTYGYATYRIFLKLPSAEKKRYSLKIRDQAHAYKLFIDGKFIKEWGKVGTDFQTTKPEMQPDIISFENKSETLEIVFQVANFHHRVSGLRYRIWFGEEDQISKLHQKYLIIDSFLFGGIFLISVYYFVIYNFRSKSLSSLYFAFFCLSVLAYVMGTEERTIFYFLGDFINWDWKYKFEFIWLSLIPCFLVLFFYYLFPFYKESFLKFVIPIHLVVSFLFI